MFTKRANSRPISTKSQVRKPERNPSHTSSLFVTSQFREISLLILQRPQAIYQRIGTDLIGKSPRPPSLVAMTKSVEFRGSLENASRQSLAPNYSFIEQLLFFAEQFADIFLGFIGPERMQNGSRFPAGEKANLSVFCPNRMQARFSIVSVKMTSTGIFKEAQSRCRRILATEKEVAIWFPKQLIAISGLCLGLRSLWIIDTRNSLKLQALLSPFGYVVEKTRTFVGRSSFCVLVSREDKFGKAFAGKLGLSAKSREAYRRFSAKVTSLAGGRLSFSACFSQSSGRSLKNSTPSRKKEMENTHKLLQGRRERALWKKSPSSTRCMEEQRRRQLPRMSRFIFEIANRRRACELAGTITDKAAIRDHRWSRESH